MRILTQFLFFVFFFVLSTASNNIRAIGIDALNKSKEKKNAFQEELQKLYEKRKMPLTTSD